MSPRGEASQASTSRGTKDKPEGVAGSSKSAAGLHGDQATFAVEAHKYPLPLHGPSHAPHGGEKLWSLVMAQEGMISKMIGCGDAVDRVNALNVLNELREHKESSRELTLAQATLNPINPDPQSKNEDLLSDQACHDLMSHPTTMEMVVDTKTALRCCDHGLMDTHIAQMHRDGGANFVAHIWLSLRLLIQLSNVSQGTGLEEAEAYLANFDRLYPPLRGDENAIQHWEDLHRYPQDLPILLNRYEGPATQAFDKILRAEIEKTDFRFGQSDYASKQYIKTMRKVYTKFAKFYANQPGDDARRLCASIRLYARLPTWEIGCGDNRFFPAAVLPAQYWMSALSVSGNVPDGSDSAGLLLFEFMMDRCQLPWTAGSFKSKTTQNVKNWYGRVRGSHQVISRSLAAAGFGGRNAQLSFSISILNDPEYAEAFEEIDRILGTEIAELLAQCCTSWTGSLQYRVFETISEDWDGDLGTEEEMVAQMAAAGREIKAAIFASSDDEVRDLHEIAADIEILEYLLPQDWWLGFNFKEWSRGWINDSSKQMAVIIIGLGWGLFSQELYKSVLNRATSLIPEARYLLRVARKLEEAAGRMPWWDAMKLSEFPPRKGRMTATVPGKSKPPRESTRPSRGGGKVGGKGEPPRSEHLRCRKSSGQAKRDAQLPSSSGLQIVLPAPGKKKQPVNPTTKQEVIIISDDEQPVNPTTKEVIIISDDEEPDRVLVPQRASVLNAPAIAGPGKKRRLNARAPGSDGDDNPGVGEVSSESQSKRARVVRT